MSYKVIHFHFDTAENIGDAAVVYATHDMVENELNPSVYTYMPILYLSDYKSQMRSKISYLNFIEKTKLETKIQIIKMLKYIKKTNTKALADKINHHDIMIVGGGGLYSKWTLPFDVELIKKINIPIVIFGAGYNLNINDKPLSKEALESIRLLSDKSIFHGVRDTNTVNFLDTLQSKAELIGDPAISLNSKNINIRFPNKIKIGLNIANHNWSSQDVYLNNVINVYTDVFTKLSEKYEIEYYYLKHSIWENEVAEKLKQKIPSISICDLDAYQMRTVYENLDLVVSMMLHSSIFAFSTGINFINIAYDKKNYAFMELIENRNIIDVRHLNKNHLHDLVLSLLENKEVAYNLSKRNQLLTAQKNFVKKIHTTLRS